VRSVSSLIAAAVVMNGLSACAVVPNHEILERVAVREIVDRVQCELRGAVKNQLDKYSWFKTWNAAFELTLQVEANSAVALDSSFITPYQSGKFALGITGGVDGNATRVSTLKIAAPIAKLAKFKCPLPPPSGLALDSNLGISEWVREVLHAVNKGDTVDHVSSFGQNVSFVLVFSGGVKPGFILERFTGPGGLSGKKTDTHSLNIAFAEPDDKKSGDKGVVGPISKDKLNNRLFQQDLKLLLSPNTLRLR
jgi:hypothetical protein